MTPKSHRLLPIKKIIRKLKINQKYISYYGEYKAKIDVSFLSKLKNKKDGKLVLVTAITPTPAGEGKTTTTIGIGQALSKLGKRCIICLREPSLGPVFGVKGGATGGNLSQVMPMEDINLHFTGDIHAVTSANNLLSAMIDNHIFHGNELGIKEVAWRRCMDMNERSLRNILTNCSSDFLSDYNCKMNNKNNPLIQSTGFDITAASEIMAILCLSSSLDDLQDRLGNIIIGYDKDKNPIRCSQINANGSMAVLLKDAINPNIVQTSENSPALIHGGPFGNIAHGCSSIIAT